MGKRRGGPGAAWAAAALLALGAATARAEEPEAAPAPERVPYEAVGPSERRGRTFGVDEMQTETGEPSFGGYTSDLDQHEGEAQELRTLSRPPGPKPVDPAQEPLEVPAPLRLRRRPGEAPPPSAPLALRLCEADRERAHAEREERAAVRAYKRARRDEYPRGDAKALVVQRRDLAAQRLARAEEAWRLLLGEAAEQEIEFDAAACPAPAARAEP